MSLSEVSVARRPGGRWTGALPWLGASAGAVLLGLGLASFTHDPRPQRQRLPDGTYISLAGVSQGKQHACAVGTGWQRLWLGLFPRLRAGGATLAHGTPEDTYVLWWRMEVPSRRSWSGTSYQAPFDEHGCRYPQAHGAAKFLPVKTLDHIVAQELTAYPRRSSTVSLGFFNQRTRQLTGKFVVPNPGSQTHPEWEAEPYPIRKRSGTLELTLHELSHRPLRIQRGSAARFTLTENGRPSARWDPITVLTEDATGNIAATRLRRAEPDGSTWFNGLCAQEKAWKLAVELAPAYPPRVPPDFTWELRDVAVPARGRLTEGGDRIERNGLALEFQGLADETLRYDPQARRTEQWLAVIVKAHRAAPGACLTLREVTDERGRDLSTMIPGGQSARLEGGAQQVARPGDAPQSFTLRLPRGPQRLNLTFAVHRTHRFDFRARP